MNRVRIWAAAFGLLVGVAFLALGCRPDTRNTAGRAKKTFAASLASVSPAPETPTPTPTATPEFVVDKAMPHVHELATVIGKRPAGSEAEALAMTYLERTFSNFGYQISRPGFPNYVGGTSFNVVARFKNADYSQGYLLIGGHYDTVVTSPGANDNASGVGVILALAEALSGRNLPVEFVGFGAEEYPPSRAGHHAGSDSYAASLPDPRVVRAMLSVDMIGAGPKVHLVRYGAAADLQNELAAVAASMGIPHMTRTMGDVSDHVGFAKKGIPAVFVYSGNHPTWHQPNDIFAVVQRDAVDRTGRLVLEWLLRRVA